MVCMTSMVHQTKSKTNHPNPKHETNRSSMC
uniref:Uncharacterized protein n=1 Tax=Arundo donax TaxID=35708 RepID=A0A0A8YYY3_ARUDO